MDYENKIIKKNGLSLLRERYSNSKIVLCHGSFDLVHAGHLIHFEEAKQLGDILVVTITSDKYISKKRIFSFDEHIRAKQLASNEIINYVSIIDESSAVTSIKLLKPDYYVKGKEYENLKHDYTKNIYKENSEIEKVGGKLCFTKGDVYSSTKISHFLQSTSEAEQQLSILNSSEAQFKDIRDKDISLEIIKEYIAKSKELNICVIGETIYDIWIDVVTGSLSIKSKCMTGDIINSEIQIGGAGIIALHLCNFVKNVTLITNSNLNNQNLPSNLIVENYGSNNEIIKTRYVDDMKRSIFETKQANINPLDYNKLSIKKNEYDIILVADFGHNYLIKYDDIYKHIPTGGYIASMVQTNSSNYGFNTPNKWKNISNYICMNKLEISLIDGIHFNSNSELYNYAKEIFINATFSITLGNDGVLISDNDNFMIFPSLNERIVDTIGAGDGYFALSTLANYLFNKPLETSLFGSIGAAIMTTKKCNDTPISIEELLTVSKIVI
jgi:cytidyltransferase-like protein